MKKFVFTSFVIVIAFIIIITVISFNKNVKRSSNPIRQSLSKLTKSLTNKSSYYCKRHHHRSRVRWNYFYYYHNQDSRKSLLWCKIPKTGSTTLTKLFLHLAGANHILKRNTTKIHKTLRQFYPQASTRNSKKHLDASYKFIIVRHPFERILSAYRDKLESYRRDMEFRDGYYYKHFGKFMKTDNSTRKEPTWQEFIKYLIKTSVTRFDQHWMPMTRLCSPCNIYYDAIIKLENLTPEITKLLKKIGISISASTIGLNHGTGSSNQNIIKKYFEKLDLQDLKQLYQKYKGDFIFFGYTPFKYYKMIKEYHGSV